MNSRRTNLFTAAVNDTAWIETLEETNTRQGTAKSLLNHTNKARKAQQTDTLNEEMFWLRTSTLIEL